MGKKKKDSVIIIKEVSRYTNEQLVLKKSLHVTLGMLIAERQNPKELTNIEGDRREGEACVVHD